MNTAEQNRDEGLRRVQSSNATWFERAFEAMKNLENGTLMIGEEIRQAIEPTVGTPEHNNAYGALIAKGIREGVLVASGVYRSMSLPQSHARKTPEYELVTDNYPVRASNSDDRYALSA